MKNNKGFTLIELLTVVAIIGILAMVAIPAYLGQQRNAARSEAYANLEALRLLEEQFFSENAAYTASAGNTAAIQALLPGFQPGGSPRFTYAITANNDIGGGGQDPCFVATATGIAGTRVAGEVFNIDCNNDKDY